MKFFATIKACVFFKLSPENLSINRKIFSLWRSKLKLINDPYKTYTLKLIDDEVIIAAQINGMTNDFLCATLRNAANEQQKPLLMISANPIDSAKSGSRDMSASGMPFYAENLMTEIRQMVNDSTQLTNTEKRILSFELTRRDADVFSDKASIYEYKDLLAIMSSGKIEVDNFPGFRLFTVDGKVEYQTYSNNQIDKEIKNNNELFEMIDRSIRYGNIEVDLSRVFENRFIDRIEIAHKNEGENWSRLFTYAELIAAKEKFLDKIGNPLKIDNENILFYGDIQEYLKIKGVEADVDDVHRIINLFNAVNGDWLLRLVSSKKGSKDSTFSREKISIVAAIKFMLAFLKHKDIVWVPVSLEEMLRVSGGAGLSKDEGVLSAKNLGFEKGPTSDDLLFIGLDKSGDTPKIYLYPTEVKTGNNEVAVIKKAFEQASATAEGLHKAFNPGGEIMDTILYKVNRNFLMQMLVTSCKKMQVYHVDDSQNWDEVLDTYREAILNERYFMSENIQELLGKGAVLSFRKGLMSRRTSFKEDAINFIEMPERDEFGLILKQVAEIYEDIHSKRDSDFLLFDECIVDNLTGDLSKLSVSALDEKTTLNDTEQDVDNTDISSGTSNDGKEMPGTTPDPELNSNPEPDPKSEPEDEEDGMNILFGLNEQNGQSVIWRPNDTTQLFHTNTGIIGTMGTGKTQFTKSLITQLYREQIHNVDGESLGILIFDYKGDYNESKTDFVNATNATILKPYHLPFNPLALVKSSVFKPLLPTHTANAFKDTLSKVYNLGPKQQATLLQCIMDA